MTKTQLYLRVLAQQWQEMGHPTAAAVARHVANHLDEIAARQSREPDQFVSSFPKHWIGRELTGSLDRHPPGRPFASLIGKGDGNHSFVGLHFTHDKENYRSFGLHLPSPEAARLLNKLTQEMVPGAADELKRAGWYKKLPKGSKMPALDATEPTEEHHEPVPEDWHGYARGGVRRYANAQWWPGKRGYGAPPDYQRIHAWLGKKTSRPVAVNKYVQRGENGDIHLYLHSTPVVTYHPDGTFTLRTGGWHTPTTARTISAATGFRVGMGGPRDNRTLHIGDTPIEEGMRWPVLPQAEEVDWRPTEMIPEDYHAFRRKRKYRRFSELAKHPDLAVWHAALTDDPGKKDVFADWVEERGFPTVAGFMRQSRPPIDHPISGAMGERLLAAGQPVLMSFPSTHEPGKHTLHLSIPHGPDDRTSWMIRTDRPTAAGLVRRLAGEGVGVVSGNNRRSLGPERNYFSGATNTDASAARRFGRPKPRAADFLTAVRILRGAGQKKLHAVAADIARGLGLNPAKTRDALLDGPAGAHPGVAQAVAGADPDTARYAAAWYGLLSRTPALGLFHVRPKGPDSLYKFHVRGSAVAARRVLDRLGLHARVLMPAGAGYDIVIPDAGRRQRQASLRAANSLGGRIEESVGKLEPLGHADPAQARHTFRKVVERYEGAAR